jgi:hypothetical protein
VTPSTVNRRWGDLAQLLADTAAERLRPVADPDDTGSLAGECAPSCCSTQRKWPLPSAGRRCFRSNASNPPPVLLDGYTICLCYHQKLFNQPNSLFLTIAMSPLNVVAQHRLRPGGWPCLN